MATDAFFQCVHCGTSYPFREDYVGRMVQCSKCKQSFAVEAPASVELIETQDASQQVEIEAVPVVGVSPAKSTTDYARRVHKKNNNTPILIGVAIGTCMLLGLFALVATLASSKISSSRELVPIEDVVAMSDNMIKVQDGLADNLGEVKDHKSAKRVRATYSANFDIMERLVGEYVELVGKMQSGKVRVTGWNQRAKLNAQKEKLAASNQRFHAAIERFQRLPDYDLIVKDFPEYTESFAGF